MINISLKPAHLKRYRDIAYLLLKYGQGDLLKSAGLEEILWQEGSKERTGFAAVASIPKAEELADDLTKLGPTFVKLGQSLARRPDCLPLPYLEALSHLEEQIEPLDFATVKQIIENEIGVLFDQAFQNFSGIPISVSTLDQTHKATLRDGKHVVVKIQRPGVYQQICDDLPVLDEIAKFYNQHLRNAGKQFDILSTLGEFRRTVLAELDYRQEAHNLRTIKSNLEKLDLIVIPNPIDQYSTPRILTISYVLGEKIASAKVSGLLQAERLKLAEQVFYAYLQQILVDGFVDANPDPSNVLFTNTGKIALLGLGIVSRISPAMQESLLQLLLSIEEGRAEHAAQLLLAISEKHEKCDELGFQHAVAELVLINRDMTIEQFAIGKIIQGIAQASVKYGVTLPSEIAMLATSLLNIDYVAHIIYPNFDSKSFIHRNASQIMQKHVINSLSPAHVLHTVIEAAEFLENLPGKINKIFDSIANNDLSVKVHAIDENVLISGFQKIANRITVGLILAALIIGAAMLMKVQTNFTIWGYPGLAMLCFLVAAGCGFCLVVEILISDRRG